MNRVQPLEGFYRLVQGRHGRFLVNENDLYVGRSLIDYGEYSEVEWRFLAQLVSPGDVVLEVGAHIGALTIPLARAVGPGGRVFAAEPQPVLFQNLCANIALNGLLNVRAQPIGFGGVPGTMYLPPIGYEKPNNFGGIALATEGPGEPVRVARVDDELELPRLNFLKIDAEGMEAEVLEGAHETLARTRPCLYFENHDWEKSPRLIEFALSLGYRLWWHMPLLYNPENYFGDTEDRYPGIVSMNMLGAPRELMIEVRGLQDATDPSFHPLAPT